MRRRVGCVSLVICVSIFGAASRSAAIPLSVAYVDTATGMEWAQVSETTGFTWQQVSTACATDGVTTCAADLLGVELAGWTWAQVTQVLDLFADSTDLTRDQLSPIASAVDSTWAPQFLSIFNPTVTDTRQAVIGWAADGSILDPRSAFAPEVVDAFSGGTDSASRGSLFDTEPPFAPSGSSTRGVWLFRPVYQVPEPSTLLLLGTGAFGALRWRAHREKRSSPGPSLE